MNPTARIFLLFGAVVLLVFGVVCLKQRFGASPAPPAFIPGSEDSATGFQGHADGRPTILSAESASEPDVAGQTNVHEEDPVPLPDWNQSLNVPIKTTAPELPQNQPLQPIEPLPPPTSPAEVPEDRAAAYLQPPIGINASPTELPAPPPPTSVVTAANDSLWLISQRVYGRGDYYKALFLHNRSAVSRPDRIAAGIELSTPSISELQQLFPDACPILAAQAN